MCVSCIFRVTNSFSEYIRFVHVCISVYSGLSNTVPEYIRFVQPQISALQILFKSILGLYSNRYLCITDMLCWKIH